MSWPIATVPSTVPSLRPQRDELHVELRQEEPSVAVGETAVRDDPEVLEERAVRRLVLPDDGARGAVEREDVVVVRRHVERAADRERIRLLPAAHVRVELLEVHEVVANETARRSRA